jgi:hypothetical protein
MFVRLESNKEEEEKMELLLGAELYGPLLRNFDFFSFLSGLLICLVPLLSLFITLEPSVTEVYEP